MPEIELPAGWKSLKSMANPPRRASSRLTDLAQEFKNYDGQAFVGDDAWKHIEEEGGETMATFIEKYVRRPIKEIDGHADELLSLSISSKDKTKFSVVIRNERETYAWEIGRREDPSLASESDEAE